MVTIVNLAETATLIGDPTRTAMLFTLMDGRAFTAGELARAAGISAPTASSHLAQLCAGGLLSVERQGRHRYFRLAAPEIASILEGLLVVTAHRLPAIPRTGPRDRAMRHARICYDHLAGEVGVALFARMVAQGHVRLAENGAEITGPGARFLADLGIDMTHQRGAPACRLCLDWTERRHHLAGRAGAALCRLALDSGWMRRVEGTRALNVTPTGIAALRKHFALAP
ncbi:ArsR family transcriptional regulator [Sphingomonas gei]|uniref:ArsR family transcriptional regulator n=1 Tax=Sphingomonas gei TaxID=1395960 RepID=A0A4S1XIH1_9SPHN|nr:metalloregulator ArsR/SmtB family transcription factor [Sphingomonas gei]TGX55918.1 ArsR family transcriptional regulator [Sphingomonas gei]